MNRPFLGSMVISCLLFIPAGVLGHSCPANHSSINPCLSEALELPSKSFPAFLRALVRGRPHRTVGSFLGPRRTNPLFTGMRAHPGRALKASDSITHWIPSAMLKLMEEFLETPLADSSLEELFIYLSSRPLRVLEDIAKSASVFEYMTREVGYRLGEGRLIAGFGPSLTSKLYAVFLDREKEEPLTAPNYFGYRFAITKVADEIAHTSGPVDVPVQYAFRAERLKNHPSKLFIVPEEEEIRWRLIPGAFFKKDRWIEPERQTSALGIPADFWVVLNSMRRAFELYAKDSHRSSEDVFDEFAARFPHFEIEIREHADHAETDFSGGTPTIIIPRSFIPMDRENIRPGDLLDYVSLSEVGHLLDPEKLDLMKLGGVEPAAFLLFIRTYGIDALYQAVKPYAAKSVFARRLVEVLPLSLRFFPLVPNVHTYSDQASYFMGRGLAHMKSIFEGLDVELAKETEMLIYGVNGTRHRNMMNALRFAA